MSKAARMDTTKTRRETNVTGVEIKIVCSALQVCLYVQNASIIYFFSLDSAKNNVRRVTLLKTNRTKNAKNAIQHSARNAKDIKTTARHASLITIIWEMESVLCNVQETCFLLMRIIVFLVNNAIHHAEKDVLVQMKQIASNVIQKNNIPFFNILLNLG